MVMGRCGIHLSQLLLHVCCIDNNSFLTEVQHESIARDAESANNLFSVLQIVGQSASKIMSIVHNTGLHL